MVEPLVMGQVHDRHPAPAEPPLDPVARKLPSRWGYLRKQDLFSAAD